MTHQLQKPKSRAKQAFFLALAVAAALFIPFIIYGRGYFIYYGDFNVQQIPFYQLAHDCVRSGDIFWNWNTDLGANFIGSYSFYLLGSPFFWLTLPFPSAAVPYLMGPLLILKFACSGLTAYLYLQRFVKPENAVIGSLLYAFSGFSIYNVFFNHFHEAIVYFPLMLLGMELYMKENRRGLFALTVFLSALSNYYFFVGQVFFLLIYWLIRMLSGDWECTLGKFLWLGFEAVIGTAMAGVILLPSYLAVIQNNRTGDILAGWDALIYTKPQRLFDIIHSFFFPQDIPARPNFFPDSDNKWSSMSAWLPVFSCCGAIAYFQSRKHSDWLRRMLIILVICTLVPFFNAMFQLFNWMYYARWYYMLVLMLVLATVTCFDQEEERPVEWKRAFGWTFGITSFFVLLIGFMPKSWTPDEETGKLQFGLMNDVGRFWIYVAITVVGLLLACLLVMLLHADRRLFFRWTTGVIVCVSLISGWYLIGLGKANSNYPDRFVIERGIEGADPISLPDPEETVRVDMNDGMDNQAMFWKLPTINAFHSIVPGSVMEFYESVGVPRSVGSRPEASHYALRSLLSTRWLFDYDNSDNMQYAKSEDKYFEYAGSTKMPGWTYADKQNGFFIYENQYYIPMGFTYDAYLTREEYDALSQYQRELALLKAIVLEEENAAAPPQALASLSAQNVSYSQNAYFSDCLARRETAADSFTRDNRGFTATITLEKENYVFFSVPYEEGWSATVNGEPAQIVKANVGFMAVLCPAGTDVTIRFDYMTPGLKYGLLLSLAALTLFLLYLVLMTCFDRRMRRRLELEQAALHQEHETADAPLFLPSEEPETAAADDCSPGEAPTAEEPPAVSPEDFDLYGFYPGTAQREPEAPHPEENAPEALAEDPQKQETD